MSYRTYINGHEWLGNNEMYDEIYQELVRQGCPFDEDDCVVEPFEVKDLDGIVKAGEKVIIRLVQKNAEIANLKSTIDNAIELKIDLTHRLTGLQDRAFIFISANLLKFIGDYFKDWKTCRVHTESGIIMQYKLTDKGKCLFTAY